jgi:hypothetical protein
MFIRCWRNLFTVLLPSNSTKICLPSRCLVTMRGGGNSQIHSKVYQKHSFIFSKYGKEANNHRTCVLISNKKRHKMSSLVRTMGSWFRILPEQWMSFSFLSVFILSYVRSGLATGRSPFQGFLYRLSVRQRFPWLIIKWEERSEGLVLQRKEKDMLHCCHQEKDVLNFKYSKIRSYFREQPSWSNLLLF